MDTPRPYSQRKLRDGTILREFRADTRSEELVWHQDREHRSVRVIESGGWMLQLEEGLPFPLIKGKTYEIPPRSWHRVLRGPGKLKIEIQEGNTMRITESQLRRIVREELALEAEKQAAPLKPIYAGVMLDEPGELLEWWKSNVGDLLKNPIAHHMTIKFNPSAEEVKNMDIGRPVNLKVTGYANSDGIQAVVVEPDGVKSANSIPHITVATDGVTKPMMSNKVLAERGATPVKGGPTLSGKIGFFASGKDWFDSSQLG